MDETTLKRGMLIDVGSYSMVFECLSLNENTTLSGPKVVKVTDLLTRETLYELSIMQRCRGHPNLASFDTVFLTWEGMTVGDTRIVPPECIRKMPLANIVMPRATFDLSQARQRLNRNKTTIKIIAYQLVRALYALKQLHILHGDIKPANVLIYSEEDEPCCRAVLSDYGLSRYVPSSGSLVPETDSYQPYSPWYRAPEVWMGKGYSYSADMWALGCTIFELRFGSYLFAIDPELDKIFTLEQRLEFFETRLCRILAAVNCIDAELALLLSRMVALSPERRISIEELSRASWFSPMRGMIESCMPLDSWNKSPIEYVQIEALSTPPLQRIYSLFSVVAKNKSRSCTDEEYMEACQLLMMAFDDSLTILPHCSQLVALRSILSAIDYDIPMACTIVSPLEISLLEAKTPLLIPHRETEAFPVIDARA